VQHGDELDLDDLERVEAHALGHALGQAREAMAVVGGGLMMEAQLVGQALDRTTYPGASLTPPPVPCDHSSSSPSRRLPPGSFRILGRSSR
jgi:hypothetical protein